MLGIERFDRELSDVWSLCGGLVLEGSVHGFLAENRQRVFPDEMFADLFSSSRGRPSVPGSVVATVMVLQSLEGLSDREAIEKLRFDLRWKAAAGLGLLDEGFHPTVLTLWRARFRNSNRPQRVFDAVREVVSQSGVLSGRSRRVLDSTVLDDAVVTSDTVTMITAQIRKCRRLVPQTREVVLSRDYGAAGKPWCDWDDPQSRSELIDGLVSDGLAVLGAVKDADLDGVQSDAVGLLGVVVGQDVEPDPEREGKWRIARRVARDRTISVVDPQTRHGRKTTSQRRDGYKAHIAAEPDTGIVTACDVTPANTADGQVGVELLEGEDPGLEVIADSAYGSGQTLSDLEEARHTTTIKPIPQRRNPRLGSDQFTRDDFVIDEDQRQVTCPAGNTATISPKGNVYFGKICAACPLRDRCTTSKTGRSMQIHPHNRLLVRSRRRWKRSETKKRYHRHRPAVERLIAHTVANGHRKLRYRGVRRNRQQLHTRIAAINLRRLLNLGLCHTATGWAIQPT